MKELRNKMKNFYLFTVLLVVLCMIPNSVLAYIQIAVENNDGKTIYYKSVDLSNETELEVTYNILDRYTGEINIPATVTYMNKTYTVTSIYYFAFFDCSELTSVSIPNTVKEIRPMSFLDCI